MTNEEVLRRIVCKKVSVDSNHMTAEILGTQNEGRYLENRNLRGYLKATKNQSVN